jgi:hypothetical protein
MLKGMGNEMKIYQQRWDIADNIAETSGDITDNESAFSSPVKGSVGESPYMDESVKEEKQQPENTSARGTKLQAFIVAICAYCKKVRDDDGLWHQIESYTCNQSAFEFSHGICPDCYQRVVEDFKLH